MTTYVITGAGSGIGAEIARRLRESGHDLVAIVRSERRAAELAGPGVRTVVADLERPETIADALAPLAEETFAGLVHSAGIAELGTVAETAADVWSRTLTVNVVAVAEVTRVLLPALRRGRADVVLLNSGAGLRTNAGWTAYAASKHALKALADGLREEEPALRVTSVYPGRTATAMQRGVREQEGGVFERERYSDPATVAGVVVSTLTLPVDSRIDDVTVRSRG
ncbi:SDR family oxidoreductase [Embleya scabrispora]|uniref:SDR family oxidoreductase n=1 Tax=Embleya scabrispora TaxID=159449 RepID=UPI0004758EC9|nr:SDR family oxidoreductase [Embleya scabrispora]MYS81796.1 SDR family oxidoreductase [Streptomyces sp. SID5474]